MNKTAYQFFRLRLEESIVGYMRYLKPERPYFSKDKLWWTGQSIPYSAKDSYSETLDINKQWIFEKDICTFKPIKKTSDPFSTVILCDQNSFNFIAIRTDTYEKIEKKDWVNYKITILSTLFYNEELQERLEEKGLLND